MSGSGLHYLSPDEQHERNSKLFGGYAAFVAALLVSMVAMAKDYPRAWLVIALLAVSLPSLFAHLLLDFTVRKIQRRKNSMYRGLAFAFGMFPSLAAIAILVGHFSIIAAVLFVLLILFWSLAIDVVTFVGGQDRQSDI